MYTLPICNVVGYGMILGGYERVWYATTTFYVIHPMSYTLPSYYTLLHTTYITHHVMRYVMCYVSRVSLMSVLVHGQLKLPIHGRQKHPRTEGALARSAPSELRPNNHQDKNVSKASRPLLRPLGGTNNNQATSNDSDVLNYYCVRPDCYFCRKCEGLTDS